MNKVEVLLKAALPDELVDAIINSYREIEQNFVLGKWKPSELDAGHFVEAVRRVVELKLFGDYTPIGDSLKRFSDDTIKSYERKSGDESYRMLIPRVLKSIFNIRNKRGVGHLSGFSPNEMDATLILYSSKWVLAEIVRLESGLSIDKTQKLVEEIVERQIELVWRDGETVRVLAPSMKTSNQVLVLLLERSPQSDAELMATIEYTHSTKFRAILQKQHKTRLIEFNAKTGICKLTPLGIIDAEQVILKSKYE